MKASPPVEFDKEDEEIQRNEYHCDDGSGPALGIVVAEGKHDCLIETA